MQLTINDLTWFGRTLDHNGIRYFDFSASGFEFSFYGTKAECKIISDSHLLGDEAKGVLGVYVSTLEDVKKSQNQKEIKNAYDKDLLYPQGFKKIVLENQENNIILFESEKPQKVHIKVLRLSEAIYGYSGFDSAKLDGELLPAEVTSSSAEKTKAPLKLEFIGDSITCGYGIEGIYGKDTFTTKQERPDLAYAYLTAQALGAEYQLVSRSGIGLISCYTDPLTVTLPNHAEPLMSQIWPYTDRYLSQRLGIEPELWDESRFSPDIVIIHLGTNDTSWVRGLEDRRLSFVNLYEQMIEAIHRRSPKARILGCLGAMGQELCASVEEAFERFGKTFPSVQTKVVKFPVQDENGDGVATDWHPNTITHKKIAEILTKEIKTWN